MGGRERCHRSVKAVAATQQVVVVPCPWGHNPSNSPPAFDSPANLLTSPASTYDELCPFSPMRRVAKHHRLRLHSGRRSLWHFLSRATRFRQAPRGNVRDILTGLGY